MPSVVATTPLVGATVANITPAGGSTVGVGQPITVTFTGPVANRAAVERSIRVVQPAEAPGTFQWMSDDVVQWKPATFWPAHSEVKLMVGNMPLSFDIGSSVVGVASISNHTFTVTVDGTGARYGGTYFADKVVHRFSPDGYRQQFELMRNATGEEGGPLGPLSSAASAIASVF